MIIRIKSENYVTSSAHVSSDPPTPFEICLCDVDVVQAFCGLNECGIALRVHLVNDCNQD